DELFFTTKYPVLPAAFLCLNGAVLLSAELLRKRSEESEGLEMSPAKWHEAFKTINDLTFLQALWIGFLQAAALLPGISRSGITMVGCLRAKMRRDDAAHFTFLLLTPVIVAASAKEIPKLIHACSHMLTIAGIGGVVAAIAAFLSIRFLTRYFQVGKLTPFAIYCLVAGLLCFAFFAAQILLA
ncbi:MAG TPA: undecaprenyl-diphosphate phosphatase, partial [Ktedonobacterales bacterium]|nr:undecaprenyl-diphosphate phosphatase [Ktedonobacterales bacterium]